MFYYCIECGEIYRSEKEMTSCPRAACQSDINLIKVDEMMLPVIVLLNSKGYYTKACCSGHFIEDYPSPYILFNEDFISEFERLPNMFHLDFFDNDPCLIMDDEYLKGNYMNNILNIHLGIMELIVWADDLPHNPLFENYDNDVNMLVS